MNITIPEIKKHARVSLKGKWGLGVLLTFLLFLISSAASVLADGLFGGGVSNILEGETTFLSELVSMLFSIVLMPLTITAYWFYLSLVRFEEPQISDVFKNLADGKVYLKLIIVSLLNIIFIILWSLLLIIPGIIKSLSYSQAFFLLRDHPEYTPLEAITESRKRMNGKKWKFFVMNLSFIGWAILCIFTLGIGLLWLSPYITASTATFYNELIYSQDDSAEKEPVI